MFEEELRRLMKDKENKKVFDTIGFENLSEEAKQKFVREAVEKMGKEYRPPEKKQDAPRKSGSGMAIKRRKP